MEEQKGVKEKELVPLERRALTAAEFQRLADVPPEIEWFANLQNPRTRRAYQFDIRDFMAFAGILKPEEFRIVTRARVIAWRKSLEGRNLAPTSIRRKLSALSALFNHLCESNAVLFNPTRGVSGRGRTAGRALLDVVYERRGS